MPIATSEAGQRLLIARADLSHIQMAPDPDAPAARALQPGQARLAVDSFALTANNITYAAFGEAMKYWQFFPRARRGLGLPAGVGLCHRARVACHEGGGRGPARLGLLPAGTHLVVQPARLSATGFACAAPRIARNWPPSTTTTLL
jgi:hypothetical protein